MCGESASPEDKSAAVVVIHHLRRSSIFFSFSVFRDPLLLRPTTFSRELKNKPWWCPGGSPKNGTKQWCETTIR
ncbi:AAEL005172-PA [Aedes aegypti]|uniref:AAEL005172-PA n=1 Tax=Aedes aegypti TaxID=7159 RepID=Q17AU3_AEDAE|nr:AAEL005172-PA [Aedes aegypti]